MSAKANQDESFRIAQLQRLVLAWEDINFASNGVKWFIQTPDREDLKKNGRDLKEYLFYASVISYGKMFVSSRGNKIGIIGAKTLWVLKINECRELHENLLELRNECVAHNDGLSNMVFISSSEGNELHFPQRFRKVYWSIEEAQRVWALMKSIEEELLKSIFSILKALKLEKNFSYGINKGEIIPTEFLSFAENEIKRGD